MEIERKYIIDESNRRIAVQIDINTFEKIEHVLEDYALVRLMQEAEDGDDDLDSDPEAQPNSVIFFGQNDSVRDAEHPTHARHCWRDGADCQSAIPGRSASSQLGLLYSPPALARTASSTCSGVSSGAQRVMKRMAKLRR